MASLYVKKINEFASYAFLGIDQAEPMLRKMYIIVLFVCQAVIFYAYEVG